MDAALTPDIWYSKYLSDAQRTWVDRRSEVFLSMMVSAEAHCMPEPRMDQLIIDELVVWRGEGIKQSLSLLTWLIWGHDAAHVDPSGQAVLVRLIDSMGLLDLWKECELIYKATRGGDSEGGHSVGADGGARTLWEERHGLNSASERADFAWQETLNRGFRDA